MFLFSVYRLCGPAPASGGPLGRSVRCSQASASQSIAAPAPNPTLRLWCDGDGQGRIVSDIDFHLKFAPAICLILNQLAVASVGQICPTTSG